MVYFWSLCNLKVEIKKKTLIQWYTFRLLSTHERKEQEERDKEAENSRRNAITYEEYLRMKELNVLAWYMNKRR